MEAIVAVLHVGGSSSCAVRVPRSPAQRLRMGKGCEGQIIFVDSAQPMRILNNAHRFRTPGRAARPLVIGARYLWMGRTFLSAIGRGAQRPIHPQGGVDGYIGARQTAMSVPPALSQVNRRRREVRPFAEDPRHEFVPQNAPPQDSPSAASVSVRPLAGQGLTADER